MWASKKTSARPFSVGQSNFSHTNNSIDILIPLGSSVFPIPTFSDFFKFHWFLLYSLYQYISKNIVLLAFPHFRNPIFYSFVPFHWYTMFFTYQCCSHCIFFVGNCPAFCADTIIKINHLPKNAPSSLPSPSHSRSHPSDIPCYSPRKEYPTSLYADARTGCSFHRK